MNRKQSWTKAVWTLGLLAGVFLIGAASKALAVDISSNNTAGLRVLITPHADRGVEISSGNINLDLGDVDMGFSTYTVRPATVTIVGNLTNTELTLAADIAGGWSFDDDVLTADQDKLATWALFSGVDVASAPLSNDFTIYNSTINTAGTSFAAVDVGDAANRFEGAWTGADMDAMAPQTQRHFWIKMRTPSSTSITTQQTVRFNLTSEAGE